MARTAHRKQGSEIIAEAPGAGILSRRSVLSTLGAALPFVANPPRQSHAAAVALLGGATQPARIESWPGVEGLEPLYEFKLSLDAIVLGVQDRDKWPYILKRLEKFFGGFIVNEKNFYMGVGLQYMNEMQYEAGELPNYVLLDKETRLGALEQTMKNLEDLKLVLADGASAVEAAEQLAKASQSSLQSFFALIPDQDVKAVGDLFEHANKADINGDGILSDSEIVYLSPIEQDLWKRKVKKFG